MEGSRFLAVCLGQHADSTPVWFMRQAGRYLEEYRRLRERYGMLELCRTPDLAAEVTLQPIRRFDLDAAIIFADILLPLDAMGVRFDFARGEGPVIEKPVRTPRDVRDLLVDGAESRLEYVYQAIDIVRSKLPARTALIGFAGAPFTVASYMIEGGHSRHFVATKLLMYEQPDTWDLLMKKIAQVTTGYLLKQIQAGAQVVQLFDSWVGCLSRQDYLDFVFPYSRSILSEIRKTGVPAIHFGTGTSAFLDAMHKAGSTVLGVDWRIELADVWKWLGDRTVLQGNLDPVALLGPKDVLAERVNRILDQAGGRLHIFNLGHGILPQTPLDSVELVIELIRKRD